MSNYIPNYQKANRVFSKRETQLKHAIKNGYTQEKIVKAAERLREAKLKAFKARFAHESVLQATSYVPDEQAKQWEELPVEEIIDKYRRTLIGQA